MYVWACRPNIRYKVTFLYQRQIRRAAAGCPQGLRNMRGRLRGCRNRIRPPSAMVLRRLRARVLFGVESAAPRFQRPWPCHRRQA